jgi:hypothetical protein
MEQNSTVSTSAPSKSSIVIILFTIVILLLIAVLGYLFYLSNKSNTALVAEDNGVHNQSGQNTQNNQIKDGQAGVKSDDYSLPDTTQTSTESQSKYKAIYLSSENAPLTYAFEIPVDYVAYIEEGQEGGYGARIKILKETNPGILKNAGISFWITAESDHNAAGKGGVAAIDAAYKNYGPSAKYTTLVGNKAVSAQSELGDGMFTTGFVHNTRMPQYPYFIEAYYVPEFVNGTSLSQAEYDRVLQTLKVEEKAI